jgi:lipopolysaccharide/colanic/teichoic acid biosynthesis glycosyltransferase
MIQRALKVAFDRLLALLLLLLLAPLLVGVALWILAESGRPVLFRQLRAGKGGRPFEMLKFRTMVPDAIELGQRLGISDDPFGLVKDDPRITRSGRFLRRTSLDELPQLWNILRGEMSVVGPRPDLLEQAAHYTESERGRLAVTPGVTGLAQVHGRDEIPWPERFKYDLEYVETWSLWLDLKIILKTFPEFLRSEPDPVEDTMNIERARGE